MSTIGKINRVVRDGKTQLVGYVTTLQINLRFRLVELPKAFMNAPDYQIMAVNSNGDETQIGSVWRKSSNKIEDGSREFFSMTFDDPSFLHPLSVAAFQFGEGLWDIVWRRRQAA